MFKTFLQKVSLIIKDKFLLKKIIFIAIALMIFRLLATIPVPGVDVSVLDKFFNDNQFLGLLNLFSGGGLSGLSIMMLGVGPYITGSIIMQVLTMISPKLKAVYQEDGEAGRRKFAQYSRMLTVPLAIIQGLSFLLLLQQQNVLEPLSLVQMITNITVITAGSVLLMWIGELMTEFGVGNGISLIIFAGIVAGLPNSIRQILFTYEPSQIPTYLAFLVVGLIIVAGVVIITEAERPVPITYAKQVRGNKTYGGTSTYLPLRLNMAGVIPIIFALSILLLPRMILNFLVNSSNPIILSISDYINLFLTNSWLYGITYFVLVFLLTYFYTAVTFDPETTSKNLQKSGAFIPGVRPGQSTAEYLGKVLSRITFIGALFLGSIAVLPVIVQSLTGITSLTIGGTALLIAVSVVIDLVNKIDAQVSMREY